MKSALEINGRKLSPIKDAARVTSYSPDYVTRLAREGKVVAVHVGRQWFVDIESLQAYAESVALEQVVRKRQLSEERKRERQLREVVELQRARRTLSTRGVEARAILVAMFVLVCGLSAGAVAQKFSAVTLPTIQDSLAVTFSATQSASVAGTANQTSPNVDGAAVAPAPTPTPATRKVMALGQIEAGVLLLPQATTTINELFSDMVTVETLPDGTQVVRRVDANGQPVGNPVPYVVVPIKQEKI
jgi:hypothetical protein